MFDEKIATLNRAETQSKSFEKRTYTVNEIQDILGIGRTAAYSLVKAGCFNVLKIGGSIRISKKSFDKWLDNSEGGE